VLVRPLLDYTHEDLKGILRRHGVTWREDPTNTDESIRRNKMRRTVIPWLERNLDPAIRRHLAQSAEILREDDAALDGEATALLYRITDDDGRLVPEPLLTAHHAIRRRAVRMFLRNAGRPDGFLDTEKFLARAEREAKRVEVPDEYSFVVTPLRGIVPGSKRERREERETSSPNSAHPHHQARTPITRSGVTPASRMEEMRVSPWRLARRRSSTEWPGCARCIPSAIPRRTRGPSTPRATARRSRSSARRRA